MAQLIKWLGKQRNAELTRQRLIEAARQVFLEHGVSRTTMAHIAAQAGVTRGAVYWHFNNKLDLFRQCGRRYSSADGSHG